MYEWLTEVVSKKIVDFKKSNFIEIQVWVRFYHYLWKIVYLQINMYKNYEFCKEPSLILYAL